MTQHNRIKIHLVHSSDALPASNARKREAVQLSFPFPEPDVFVALNVIRFEHTSFKNALEAIRPRWIFDARAAPRLDRLAGNRSRAFDYFNIIGSNYIDIFGFIGLDLYKSAMYNHNIWGDFVENTLTEAADPYGPYLALIDDDVMMHSFNVHFNSVVHHATGKNVSLSSLNYEEAYHHYF